MNGTTLVTGKAKIGSFVSAAADKATNNTDAVVAALIKYGPSICCGPAGHGLCSTPKCHNQLYAMNGDCTSASAEATTCAFGVAPAAGGDGKVALLVGSASFFFGPKSTRGHVTAVAFHL